MPEPIKPEAILTFLGFKPEEITSEEVFKTNFESKFGVKELMLRDPEFTGKLFGRKMGDVEAKIKASAIKMGAEFEENEIKGLKIEEVIDHSFKKIADLNAKAMAEAEKLNKGSVEEQVKAWKDKASAFEAKSKEWEGMAGKTATDFEAFKKDAVTASKTRLIHGFKQSAMSKLEFKQDISAVEKTGFESVVNNKYDFDLDENQVVFVKDKTSGQRIPSKKVTGQFMTADEILQDELIANKLAKINKDGGKPVTPKYGNQVKPAEGAPAKTLFIHPAARAAANM